MFLWSSDNSPKSRRANNCTVINDNANLCSGLLLYKMAKHLNTTRMYLNSSVSIWIFKWYLNTDTAVFGQVFKYGSWGICYKTGSNIGDSTCYFACHICIVVNDTCKIICEVKIDSFTFCCKLRHVCKPQIFTTFKNRFMSHFRHGDIELLVENYERQPDRNEENIGGRSSDSKNTSRLKFLKFTRGFTASFVGILLSKSTTYELINWRQWEKSKL